MEVSMEDFLRKKPIHSIEQWAATPLISHGDIQHISGGGRWSVNSNEMHKYNVTKRNTTLLYQMSWEFVEFILTRTFRYASFLWVCVLCVLWPDCDAVCDIRSVFKHRLHFANNPQKGNWKTIHLIKHIRDILLTPAGQERVLRPRPRAVECEIRATRPLHRGVGLFEFNPNLHFNFKTNQIC